MRSHGSNVSDEAIEPRQLDLPLQAILDEVGAGVAVFDPAGTCLYANPSLIGILSLVSEDVGELKLADLAPADPLSSAYIEFARFCAGKLNKITCDCTYRSNGGALVWVRMCASKLASDSDKQAANLMLQLTDISKQKSIEVAQAYHAARWNGALEAAGQGVWDHDIRKDEMFYSNVWRQMRGFEPDEYVDGALESWFARVHPDDLEYVKSLVKKQDRGEADHDQMVYRECHRDGHYVWIWSRGRPIEWDENGEAIRTIGVDTDITDIKNIEAQLAEEKERLRVTLQSIGDGVISTDASGIVSFLNSAAESMTGWCAQDAIGKPIETVFGSTLEANEKAKANSVRRCLSSGSSLRSDGYTRLTDLKGETRFVREMASPLCEDTGAIIGAVMVFQDATTRRAMQQKLEYSATHDTLTDLPNRKAFDARLDETILSAKDEKRQHALCLIDLDHFKTVNDEGGHLAGDDLLKEISTIIGNVCRRGDFAARIGGDEFAVVLADCDVGNAKRVGEKLVHAISSHELARDGKPFTVGASVGIAAVCERTGDADIAYREADSACYAAKAKGRNRVEVHRADAP